jgi:DNA-binding MarR family transcriptional regulator
LDVDGSVASTVVEQLVKGGFAVRHRDPEYWRRKLVWLTEAGETVKRQLLLGRVTKIAPRSSKTSPLGTNPQTSAELAALHRVELLPVSVGEC